jgi:hypothetical protein
MRVPREVVEHLNRHPRLVVWNYRLAYAFLILVLLIWTFQLRIHQFEDGSGVLVWCLPTTICRGY